MSVMSFRQQLARQTVNLQQAYDVETQQMTQQWVAETREKFIQECQTASQQRQFSSRTWVTSPGHLIQRGVPPDLLRQQLQGVLVDLGFQDGSVSAFLHSRGTYMTAKWAAEDATSTSPERSPKAASGTCVTCPICHEHGPAVALVPCGHVLCRDCHRSKQLRQCPMCRKVITSATQGLFMD